MLSALCMHLAPTQPKLSCTAAINQSASLNLKLQLKQYGGWWGGGDNDDLSIRFPNETRY